VRAVIFTAALASTGPATAARGIYKPSGRSLLIHSRLIPNTSAWREPVRASFGSRRPSPDRRGCLAYASSSSAVTAKAAAVVEAAVEVMVEARRDAKWRRKSEEKIIRRNVTTTHAHRTRNTSAAEVATGVHTPGGRAVRSSSTIAAVTGPQYARARSECSPRRHRRYQPRPPPTD